MVMGQRLSPMDYYKRIECHIYEEWQPACEIYDLANFRCSLFDFSCI